jgi:hypothetical protein
LAAADFQVGFALLDAASEYKSKRGTLAKYIRLVKSASEGCVTDE